MTAGVSAWLVCLERRIITHAPSGITFRVEDTRLAERKVVTNMTAFPRSMGKAERTALVAESGRRYLRRLREDQGSERAPEAENVTAPLRGLRLRQILSKRRGAPS